MTEITKDMTIGQVIGLDSGTARVFFMHGMYCVGCPHSALESIEEASAGHGVDCDNLVAALNEYFAEKENA